MTWGGCRARSIVWTMMLAGAALGPLRAVGFEDGPSGWRSPCALSLHALDPQVRGRIERFRERGRLAREMEYLALPDAAAARTTPPGLVAVLNELIEVDLRAIRSNRAEVDADELASITGELAALAVLSDELLRPPRSSSLAPQPALPSPFERVLGDHTRSLHLHLGLMTDAESEPEGESESEQPGDAFGGGLVEREFWPLASRSYSPLSYLLVELGREAEIEDPAADPSAPQAIHVGGLWYERTTKLMKALSVARGREMMLRSLTSAWLPGELIDSDPELVAALEPRLWQRALTQIARSSYESKAPDPRSGQVQRPLAHHTARLLEALYYIGVAAVVGRDDLAAQVAALLLEALAEVPGAELAWPRPLQAARSLERQYGARILRQAEPPSGTLPARVRGLLGFRAPPEVRREFRADLRDAGRLLRVRPPRRVIDAVLRDGASRTTRYSNAKALKILLFSSLMMAEFPDSTTDSVAVVSEPSEVQMEELRRGYEAWLESRVLRFFDALSAQGGDKLHRLLRRSVRELDSYLPSRLRELAIFFGDDRVRIQAAIALWVIDYKIERITQQQRARERRQRSRGNPD